MRTDGIEGARIINDFIEPNKKQYVIPVYQRNYAWSREDCMKLFEDVVHAYKKDKNHFCGSIVIAPLKEEHGFNYYVIVDGQQRLITVYLLIKALIDCEQDPKKKERLSEDLFNTDRYDTYDITAANKLKLKPIKTDNQQFIYLMENEFNKIDKSSGIWTNYSIFKGLILKALAEDDRLDCRSIYKGLENLICARVKLEAGDNAQEVFERINSTGVPLSLADKIRNYVLMTDADQERLYETYWLPMENLISVEQMSDFFQTYLNLKVDSLVTDRTAYNIFKQVFVFGKYAQRIASLCIPISYFHVWKF